MKKTLMAFGLAFASLLAAPALAQSAAPRWPVPGAGRKARHHPAGGGLRGPRSVKDPRIGAHFKDVKPAALKESLTDQFCQLSGGPCKYEGADMKSAHADMDINKGHFHALVEVLQGSMDAQGIPFAQQNRLLALLAPMHRDVITVR